LLFVKEVSMRRVIGAAAVLAVLAGVLVSA
jgi:hypothetical protein